MTPARADNRAAAQQLFAQGKALMESGRVAEACPKFDAAAQLSQTPGVRLNLAECWTKLGRVASAWAKYNEALALADREGDVAAADAARRGRAELEPKLSYLTIAVAAGGAPGLAVSLDGATLPAAALGTPLPVDPGEHMVSASAPGDEGWTQQVTVRAGGDKPTLTIPPLAVRSAPAPGGVPAPPAVGPPSPSAESPATGEVRFGAQRISGIVSGGLGLAGVAVGTVLGLAANGKKNDYQGEESASGDCVTVACHDANQKAVSDSTVSTVAFVAGGALVAAGAVLWLAAPSGASASASAVSARIGWFGGSRTSGLEVVGSWR